MSISSTPHNNINSSRTPRRLIRQSMVPVQTPDSLNKTNRDTPAASASSKRANKDKISEIGNLLTVAVRVRPMNNRELSCKSTYNTISVHNNEITIKATASNGIETNHIFQYDHVFYCVDEENTVYASQKQVFEAIGKPMLDNVFAGYNACLLAYGQTGSGKSYSMMGEHCDIEDDELIGIIPRFCNDLFTKIVTLSEVVTSTVEISYFEIYNEKIYDLLTSTSGIDKGVPLKVREHPIFGPHVVNLSARTVNSYAELRKLLQIGNKHRATATTVFNDNSSRSHAIVSIELNVSDIGGQDAEINRRSKISLVDLAGSERVGSTSSNDDRHREGVSINQSLLTLGKVIIALSDHKRATNFIPYRESTLTWLLRESLGGNSLTSMLATISPASSHVEETLSTLRYACQARCIINRAYVNENPNDRIIRELRAEVLRLKSLHQDYEKKAPLPHLQGPTIDELEELRDKLSQKERLLEEAQRSWEQKFLEMKERQIEKLTLAEKLKEELESRVRVISIQDPNIVLAPYKSNFLEKVEKILKENTSSEVELETLLKDTEKWCYDHGLQLNFTFDIANNKIIARDLLTNSTATCNKSILENRFEYSEAPAMFLKKFIWKSADQKLSKPAIYHYWKEVRNSSNIIKFLVEKDDELRNAHEQLDEALKTFENALNKSRNLHPTHETAPFEEPHI